MTDTRVNVNFAGVAVVTGGETPEALQYLAAELQIFCRAELAAGVTRVALEVEREPRDIAVARAAQRKLQRHIRRLAVRTGVTFAALRSWADAMRVSALRGSWLATPDLTTEASAKDPA